MTATLFKIKENSFKRRTKEFWDLLALSDREEEPTRQSTKIVSKKQFQRLSDVFQPIDLKLGPFVTPKGACIRLAKLSVVIMITGKLFYWMNRS